MEVDGGKRGSWPINEVSTDTKHTYREAWECPALSYNSYNDKNALSDIHSHLSKNKKRSKIQLFECVMSENHI